MIQKIIILALFLIFERITAEDDLYNVSWVPKDPDVGLDMPEIITTRGYPVEVHHAVTKDGYVLTLFRIPHNRQSNTVGSPVILQHGLLDSSYTWVSNYPDESLGYILSDAGYDVWFGNNRGNRYGRNHTTLNPDDGTNNFWAFTWDEMAAYDTPTLIHYILDTTGYDSLSWVGHSEGTIQMFAAASSTATSTDTYFTSAINSINLFVALAPVAYVTNLESKILRVLANSDVLYKLMDRGYYEFLPYGPIDQIAPELCHLAQRGCNFFLMTICGPTQNLNTSRIQVYVSNTPAGTSSQNMLHWLQGVVSPNFQKYDYGTPDLNIIHYGTSTPPLYNLSSLSVKAALFAGKHDYLADPKDVQRLINEVPTDKIVYIDYQDDYAHLDFTWAYNANTRIYGKVVNLLQQYTPSGKKTKFTETE
jgi:pimeloyl-ACP methyl ester carboxylesterase